MMDKTPGNGRVQLRVHEFIKKLQPDNIKARFQNVRKFITSAAAVNKRSSASTSTSASTNNSKEECNVDIDNNRNVVESLSDIVEKVDSSVRSVDDVNIIHTTTINDKKNNCYRNDKPINYNGDNDNNNSNIGCRYSDRRTSSTRYSDGSCSSVISYFDDYDRPLLFSKLNSILSSSSAVVINKMESKQRESDNVPKVIVESDTTCGGLSSDDGYEGRNFRNGITEQRSDTKLQITIETDVSPRNKSPVTVQEWVDSLPITPAEELPKDECDLPEPIQLQVTEPDQETDNLTLGAEAVFLCNEVNVPAIEMVPNFTLNSNSCAEPSEVDSHCSSVDSILDARKPDPEEILLGLGFGGSISNDFIATGRVPTRFLNPSQLKGIDIEDFIRQQQNLIQTYESGYCGYRGLTGQLHSKPSAIVAKIMEKLRDHNQETVAAASTYTCHRDFTRQNSKISGIKLNKFARVGRHVLTKIRCKPGSVLTADNRKWLESQGQKSPEICRRLIIGQQSFTFGHDGDLIESPDSSQVTIDKATSDVKKTDVDDNCDNKERNSPEATDELVGVVSNCHDDHQRLSEDRRCSNSRPQKDDQHFNDGDDFKFVEKTTKRIRSSESLREENISRTDTDSGDKLLASLRSSLSSLVTDSSYSENFSSTRFIDDRSKTKINDRNVDNQTDDNERNEQLLNNSAIEDVLADKNRIDDDGTTFSSRNLSELLQSSSLTCLHDELKDSGVSLTSSPVSDIHLLVGEEQYSEDGVSPPKRLDSYVCNSKVTARLTEELSTMEEQLPEMEETVRGQMENEDEAIDPSTNVAADVDDNFINGAVQKQYEDLVALGSKLQDIGIFLDIGSKNDFTKISDEQRYALQSRMVRKALDVYLTRLGDDEMHSELKSCLNTEAQKLVDLVDTNSSSSKLSLIVKQMSLLLQNQKDLNKEIKELANMEKKPTACHEMCDQILRKVQELEHIVQQNAQELAQMKSHLEINAHDSS